VIADLDTLLTALYVELTDRIIPSSGFGRSGPGRPPEVTGAELVCLAVAQVLLRFDDERHWLRAVGETGTAAGAGRRLMHHHAIRVISQLHRRARLPLRTPRPAALAAQRLRRRLGKPVRRRRLAGVPRVLLHLRGQGLYPGLQFRDLRHLDLQRRDDLVLLRQQLPQPHIRGTQPLADGMQPRDHLIRRFSLTGHTGRIGHNRHPARAGPQ
jgi:hypothetical protein